MFGWLLGTSCHCDIVQETDARWLCLTVSHRIRTDIFAICSFYSAANSENYNKNISILAFLWTLDQNLLRIANWMKNHFSTHRCCEVYYEANNSSLNSIFNCSLFEGNLATYMYIRVLHSHWSRSSQILGSDWLKITMLLIW